MPEDACDNRMQSFSHSDLAPNIDTFFKPSRIYERQVLKRFDCREVLTSLVMNQKSNMTKTTIPSRTKQSSGVTCEIRDIEGDEKAESACPKTRACQTN